MAKKPQVFRNSGMLVQGEIRRENNITFPPQSEHCQNIKTNVAHSYFFSFTYLILLYF